VTETTQAPVAATRRRRTPSGRLLALLAAGLVDSLVLSMAWTVVMLRVTRDHGLVAAGLCSTAMLLGVALSAPFAGALSRRLEGRRLLRVAGGTEALLRLSVFALLYTHAPLGVLFAVVTAMNVVAWTGYAGMRAEVAAVSQGAVGITWYGSTVMSIEAVGMALGAVLPLSGAHTADALWATMAAVYVLGLLPTMVVAGGSRVPRAPARPPGGGRVSLRRSVRPSAPVLVGTLLMLVASAPPQLAVALADELHGRSSVALAGISFTVGALLSPALAARLQASGANRPVTWVVVAAGIVAGWSLAPFSVAWLCVAQLGAGLCSTAVEGLIDSYAAERRPDAVTATLARTTAARALGSAAASAAFPTLVLAVGLSVTTAGIAAGLLLAASAAQVVSRTRRTGQGERAGQLEAAGVG
jgi:MFS family permease